MVSDMLFRKRMGMPYLSLLLAASCLLVSIPTYFHPELYDVFGGDKPIHYPWQAVTFFLQHGSYMGSLPLPLHLFCNLAVIMTFGVISEKVLGTKRLFYVILVSSFTALMIKIVIDVQVNGASGIIWAFAPIAFLTLFKLYRKDKVRLLSDFWLYVCLFIFFMIWVVISIGNIALGWYYSQVFHVSATVVGAVFTFVWRKDVAKWVDNISGHDLHPKRNDPWDKRIVGLSLFIPVSVIIILSLSLSGILTRHASKAQIVEIFPPSGPVDVLNKTDQQILIKFSRPMKKEVNQSRFNFHSDGEMMPLLTDKLWVNDQTLSIKYSRELKQGEKIDIYLRGFTDLENKKVYDEIYLQYGY